MLHEAIPLLRQYLRQKADDGLTHILLGQGAKGLLSTLGSRTQSQPARSHDVVIGGALSCNATDEESHDGAPLVRPRNGVSDLEVPGGSREEKLAHLAQMAEESQAARELGTLRSTMVFAVGNPNAEIMFVGEAPGAEEERQREPFVGPAGQLLTKIVSAMGLKRSDVYISNICKFRPAIENQGSGNRKPTAQEMSACLPFILAEVDIIRPKIIIALGGTASEGLGIEGSVSRNRGRFHSLKNIPVVVTYHPSYLLRQEQEGLGLQAKRQSWEDMLMAMEKAGLPITEKQRNFFKSR